VPYIGLAPGALGRHTSRGYPDSRVLAVHDARPHGVPVSDVAPPPWPRRGESKFTIKLYKEKKPPEPWAQEAFVRAKEFACLPLVPAGCSS